MSVGNETNSRKALFRTLFIAVLTNAVLWMLSVIALIFVLQRCPSAKGLFVIQAAGLASASAIIVVARKQR